MQRIHWALTFSIVIILLSTFPFVAAQESEGPEIYIRYNGLCGDGQIWWPRNIVYRIQIEVSDADNVSIVFADITEDHTTNTYRVYASLSEGTSTNGTWVVETAKFLSWEGGVFDIRFTVWACDGLENWNSALGYRSTGMSPSFLPPLFLILSIVFLAYVLNSTRKRRKFQKTRNLASLVE